MTVIDKLIRVEMHSFESLMNMAKYDINTYCMAQWASDMLYSKNNVEDSDTAIIINKAGFVSMSSNVSVEDILIADKNYGISLTVDNTRFLFMANY